MVTLTAVTSCRADSVGPATVGKPSVSLNMTTPDLSAALSAEPGMSFGRAEPGTTDSITVDDQKTYQSITGFGATFTDSSAWLVRDKLSAAARATLMQQLFSSNGIALNFLRQPMGATDFIINGPGSSFSYDDNPPGGSDPALAHFSVAHDEPYVLPVLKQSLSVNPNILVMFTAWTAPAWMKLNHSLTGGGSLDPRYYATWAQYYEKAIAAYTAAGVPIWATSGQNEPSVAKSYPSMTWTSAQQAKFLVKYLQPTLSAASYHPHILIGDTVCFDSAYVSSVLRDPAYSTSSIAGGVSAHGYCGSYRQLGVIHDDFPKLDVYQTELSPGCQPRQTVDLGIQATRNWAKTITTWNVALDQENGPYYTGDASKCIGLVTIDQQTGRITYNLPYFQEGQFSRYVSRGAYRIDSTEPNGIGLTDVAFKSPDGQIVLVVHNASTSTSRQFTVDWRGESFVTTLPAGATGTYRWQ
jgi:glucosylceramidase